MRPTGGRKLPLGRSEELLLLAIVLLGGAYPMVREAFPSAMPVLCGLPTPDGTAIVERALAGKLLCAISLAALLPLVARSLGGSWSALTRSSVVRSALVAAGTVTAALTAYDACTGFHATERTAQGCACWLTALVAGLTAFAVAVLILAGRALLRTLHEALDAMADAFFLALRCEAPPVLRLHATTPATPCGVLLARRGAGRAPPRPSVFRFV